MMGDGQQSPTAGKCRYYTESGLKLPGLDLASLATQGVGAGAQPNAYTGYGIGRHQQ